MNVEDAEVVWKSVTDVELYGILVNFLDNFNELKSFHAIINSELVHNVYVKILRLHFHVLQLVFYP